MQERSDTGMEITYLENYRFNSSIDKFRRCVDIAKLLMDNNQMKVLIDEFDEKLTIIYEQVYNTKAQNTSDEYSIVKKNIKLSEGKMTKSESATLTNDIITYVKQLADVKDIQDQICICVKIKEQTLRLLKMVKSKTDENYQKGCIHLFFQAITRNYAKSIFTQSQLNLLVEVLEESKKPFVNEERYFELDEKLYDNKMSVFPEEE